MDDRSEIKRVLLNLIAGSKGDVIRVAQSLGETWEEIMDSMEERLRRGSPNLRVIPGGKSHKKEDSETRR